MDLFECPLEFKAGGKPGAFQGYGAVFNNKDLGDDIILPGAFEKIKKTDDGKVRIALYHDLRRLVGKASVSQDEHGLRVDGALNMSLSYAADTYELMKDGSLNGMSVGFNILPGGAKWDQDENDDVVRIISKAELWEVSLVPFGMNPEATVDQVKEAPKDIRELELFLRKHFNFSRREATAVASVGFKGLQRDAGGPDALSDSAFEELKQEIADISSNLLR